MYPLSDPITIYDNVNLEIPISMKDLSMDLNILDLATGLKQRAGVNLSSQ
jgi:hypothetical protein